LNRLSRSFALLSIGLGLAFCQAEPCRASAYHVSPVQVALSRRAPTALLTLQNDSRETLRFELAAFEWNQSPRGEMQLAPTRDIVFFPTVIAISPGEERKVRVGASAGFGPVEKSYRLFFDELPPLETVEGGVRQVRVLTQMGIPIFFQPEKVVPQARLETVSLDKGFLSFSYRNSGNVHTTLRGIRVKGVGGAGETLFETEADGWYVLAGGSREYRIEVPKEYCPQAKHVVIEVRTDRETLSEHLDPSPDVCS